MTARARLVGTDGQWENLRMMKHARVPFAAVITLVAGAACSSPPGVRANRNPAEVPMCESMGTTQLPYKSEVPTCTKLHPGFPRISLPEPDAEEGGSLVIYGALAVDNGYPNHWRFYDRMGKSWRVTDPTGAKAFRFGDAKVFSSASEVNVSYRYLFTVFRAVAAETHLPDTGEEGLHIKSLTPVLWVDPAAVEGSLLGEWAGTTTPRIPVAERPPAGHFGQKAFRGDQAVALRVRFDSITVSDTGFSETRGNGKVPGTKVYRLKGRILNGEELKGLGEANPFYGATSDEVTLYRNLNMHGLLRDDHWVFDYPLGSADLSMNGMSLGTDFMSVAALLVQSPNQLTDDQTDIVVLPHIPFVTNGHRVRIRPVP
jgi:hypothetical protein